MASSCEAKRLNQTSVKTAQSHHHCLYMQGQSSWFQALNMVWSKTEVSRAWRTSDQAKNCGPGSSGLWGASACAEVRVRRKILFYNCLGKLYLGTSGDYRKVNLCHFKLSNIIMLGDHCPGEKKKHDPSLQGPPHQFHQPLPWEWGEVYSWRVSVDSNVFSLVVWAKAGLILFRHNLLSYSRGLLPNWSSAITAA